MSNRKDAVLNFLVQARANELAIDKDRLLSDEGKAAKKAQHVDPLISASQWEASKWLKSTREGYAQAQAKELKARQSAAGKVDIQRRAYALERARLVAEHASSWETVSAAMAESMALQDTNALAAWADLEPLVRSRFDGGRSGPASDAHNGLRSTYGQLSTALEAQVDPAIRGAQAELAQAQDALADAEHFLTRLDRRRGISGEGPPLFKDLVYPVTVETRGGPDDPLGWSIQTTGGGAFGKTV